MDPQTACPRFVTYVGSQKVLRAELYFSWWANNGRMRYAIPQTKPEEAMHREAAWCCGLLLLQKSGVYCFCAAESVTASTKLVSARRALAIAMITKR